MKLSASGGDDAKTNARRLNVRSRPQASDDTVEGHGMRPQASDDDVEGARKRPGVRVRSRPQASDDTVEGHGMRPQASDDTEGHSLKK